MNRMRKEINHKKIVQMRWSIISLSEHIKPSATRGFILYRLDISIKLKWVATITASMVFLRLRDQYSRQVRSHASAPGANPEIQGILSRRTGAPTLQRREDKNLRRRPTLFSQDTMHLFLSFRRTSTPTPTTTSKITIPTTTTVIKPATTTTSLAITTKPTITILPTTKQTPTSPTPTSLPPTPLDFSFRHLFRNSLPSKSDRTDSTIASVKPAKTPCGLVSFPTVPASKVQE